MIRPIPTEDARSGAEGARREERLGNSSPVSGSRGSHAFPRCRVASLLDTLAD
jgi:hypothetical protein